jgi:hypothetical protein
MNDYTKWIMTKHINDLDKVHFSLSSNSLSIQETPHSRNGYGDEEALSVF